MNTSNDIFSLPRFVAFAKKEFTEQRRQLLLQLGTLLGAITFTGLAMCYGVYQSEWARAATLQCDPMAFSLTNGVLERNWVRLWFVLAAVFYGSLAAWNMDNKAKRIARIMSPASQQEKFIFGAILVTVIMPLLTFLTLEVYELIRYVTFRYVVDTPCSDYVQFMNIPAMIVNDVKIGGFLLGLFCFNSIFVLGSCIWHNKAMIKTIVAILAVYFVLMSSAVLVGVSSNFFIKVTTSVDIVTGTIGVINWVIAYYIFTRAEVVGRVINKK